MLPWNYMRTSPLLSASSLISTIIADKCRCNNNRCLLSCSSSCWSYSSISSSGKVTLNGAMIFLSNGQLKIHRKKSIDNNCMEIIPIGRVWRQWSVVQQPTSADWETNLPPSLRAPTGRNRPCLPERPLSCRKGPCWPIRFPPSSLRKQERSESKKKNLQRQ